MKITVSGRLIILAFLFVIFVSCVPLPVTEVLPAQNPPTAPLLPVATNMPTFTEFPTEPPRTTTPPPAVQTTNLRVDVTKLSSYAFEVRAYTDLTLFDISNDGKANTCRIAKTGFSQSIAMPIGVSSAKFQLPPGEYRLSCEVPNKTAIIKSR